MPTRSNPSPLDLHQAASDDSAHIPTLCFQHPALSPRMFPSRKASTGVIERTTGPLSVRWESSREFDGTNETELPLPYGTTAYFTFLYITTRAIHTQSPRVDMGEITQFFERLGVARGAGSIRQSLRSQLIALAAARVKIKLGGFGAFTEFEAFEMTAQQCLSPPELLILSGAFYQSLTDFAMPLDSRALRAIWGLYGSPFGLDIYVWLAHRFRRLDPSGAFVAWPALQAHFGREFTRPRDFKRIFSKHLSIALDLFSSNVAEISDDGVRLCHSGRH